MFANRYILLGEHDNLLPYWHKDPPITDALGNQLHADYELNLLVLITGLQPNTRGFIDHPFLGASSGGAQFAHGSVRTLVDRSSVNRLIILNADGSRQDITLSKHAAEEAFLHLSEQSRYGLGDDLTIHIIDMIPELAGR